MPVARVPGGSCRKGFEGFEERLVEAAAKHFRGLKAGKRLERPNNRGLWRQTAGLNALTTNACDQSAWSKLPRGILRF